jgi:hypothetical protein
MDTGHTPAQLRGDAPLPIHPGVEVWKYDLSEPLVRPDLVKELPTQMLRSHKWYMEATKQGRACSRCKHHYFHGEDEVNIEFEEIY